MQYSFASLLTILFEGKSKVQKVGMKPETREGFEYEMTASLDLNINNMADASKDRTGIFKAKAPFVIDEAIGQELVKWSDSGIDYVAKIEDLLKQKGKTVDPILTTFKVFSISELTTGQYKKTIAKLESLPDIEPEKKETKKTAKQFE